MKLAVRVPDTLRGCRVLGLDVEDWVKRGLVDFVTVGEFLDSDYTMPIAEFREKFGPAMPIYASVEIEPALAPIALPRKSAARLCDRTL